LTRRWTASLEGRLIVRLTAITLAASAAGFIGLVIKSWRIARGLSDEGQADVFVGEFLKEAGWAFPLFALIVIGIVVFTVRTSLRPVANASRQIAGIAPGRSDVRLAMEGLPTEIEPFVAAVNAAIDRLEHGFEVQRRFTADAAHELRTPLAILIAGLEAAPASTEITTLRADAARMSRLVDQLVRVARLDALPTPTLVRVDLAALTAELAASMAPWAHAEGQTLALDAPDHAVGILGDSDTLTSALRNLVENAVLYSPRGTEILIRVESGGSVEVVDHGPGIPPAQRERLFDRFWRAPDNRRQGAGLGLAIVSAVAVAHGAIITCDDTPGGGATFRMALRPAHPPFLPPGGWERMVRGHLSSHPSN